MAVFIFEGFSTCPYLTGRLPSNLFGGWRNNVAICWIRAFAHKQKKKKKRNCQHPCNDSWQTITCQLRPSTPTRVCWAQSQITSRRDTSPPSVERSVCTAGCLFIKNIVKKKAKIFLKTSSWRFVLVSDTNQTDSNSYAQNDRVIQV